MPRKKLPENEKRKMLYVYVTKEERETFEAIGGANWFHLAMLKARKVLRDENKQR